MADVAFTLHPAAEPLPDFQALPDLIGAHARAQPRAAALVDGSGAMDYAALDAAMNQVAATLQRDGAMPGDTIGICASACNAYVVLFMGALRAGLAVAPLAPGSTPTQIAGMTADAGARHLFLDAANARAVPAELTGSVQRIRLDESGDGDQRLADWLLPDGARPRPVAIERDWAFNIIYSSGTTGTPKGIVQPHAMRWSQIRRAEAGGYDGDTVTLIATPLYSNTTLVVVIPTLARGGTLVLMSKFDCALYLALAEKHRATHTMLVPVQYQRLMAWPEFDRHDLSSFRFKACTSAPFRAELKAEVLRRWPGALTEYYGMTEGGGSCILYCHLFPHKLHTVGQPAEGHDVRLIDEDGRELPRSPDAIGEVVGRSAAMMLGYYHQPAKSREAEWLESRLRSRQKCDGEIEFRLPDKRWVRITERRTAESGIVTLCRDVTSRKEAELGLERAHSDIAVLADAAAVNLAFLAAFWARTLLGSVLRRPLFPFEAYESFVLLTNIVVLTGNAVLGLYGRRAGRDLGSVHRRRFTSTVEHHER